MALVAVLGPVLVAVIVMAMVVPAAAIAAMSVAVGVSLGMAVRMDAGMVVAIMGAMGVIVTGVAAVIMAWVIVAWVIATGVVVVIGAALGLERPLDHRHGAALAAHHLGEHMVVLDVERLSRDLGGRVAVADMPGDAHQPQRVVGPDLQQALGRSPDQNEAAVLQPYRVAVIERGRLVEIEQDVEAGVALQSETAAAAILVIQRQGLDDAIRLDRGFANDGGGAKHDWQPGCL